MATRIPPNRARFTVEEMARATGGRVLQGGEASIGVCSDSRAMTEGAAFVALTGDKFDGHAFLASAVALGARTLVVSKDAVGPWAGGAQPAVVCVEDTRVALGALARAHRVRWGALVPPRIVIAITGSAGKTTTKSVLSRVLDAMAPGTVHATAGNLNNDIGVPMTLVVLAASRGARGNRLRIERRAGAVELESPLLGEAGALAVAASLAVAEWATGRAANEGELDLALSSFIREKDGRLSVVPLADGTIVIDDSYNANPASMQASLRAACDVAAREKRRLVVVLGEMRELGAMSVQEHDKLGTSVASADVAEVISVGGEAERVTREAARAGKNAWFALDAEQAVGTVLSRVLPGDVVLVKGSRGVAMEKIVRALVAARGPAPRGGGAS